MNLVGLSTFIEDILQLQLCRLTTQVWNHVAARYVTIPGKQYSDDIERRSYIWTTQHPVHESVKDTAPSINLLSKTTWYLEERENVVQ